MPSTRISICVMCCLFLGVLISVESALIQQSQKTETVNIEPMENWNAFEGDIDGYSLIEGRSAVASRTQLWPNATVPYEIDPQLARKRRRFENAMRKIEQVSCVRFRERRPDDEDYVYIYSGSGCRSFVGRAGGKQNLSLGDGCRVRGVILHELLHSLGFYHMHSQSNRDDYIRIVWENVRSGAERNFIALSPGRDRIFRPFDFDSVMMYGPATFSKDYSSPTLEARLPNTEFKASKFKKSVSKGDAESLRQLYECNEFV